MPVRMLGLIMLVGTAFLASSSALAADLTTVVSQGPAGQDIARNSFTGDVTDAGSVVFWINGDDPAVFPDETDGRRDVYRFDAGASPLLQRLSISNGGLDPSVSADGSRVVWQADSAGHSTVVMRDAGGTERVLDVPPGGGVADGDAYRPRISRDGRFVVFASAARNLVATPPPGGGIYVVDTVDGSTELVSIQPDGQPGTETGTGGDYLNTAEISADGRYVVFADNGDIMLRDRQAQTTTQISTNPVPSYYAEPHVPRGITPDGRYVLYDGVDDVVADASPDATPPGFVHVYLYDRTTGTSEIADRTTDGLPATGGQSGDGAISADGRYVAFGSEATNLKPPGSSGYAHPLFLRDRVARATTLLGAEPGVELAGSAGVRMSADGRYVTAFTQRSDQPVACDLDEPTPRICRDVVLIDRGASTSPPSGTPQPIGAGGTVSTGDEATPSSPVQTAVTSPVAGEVTVTEQAAPPPGEPLPAGFSIVGRVYEIQAPVASAEQPLTLRFTIDVASLPAGGVAALTLFRDATAIAACADPDAAAADPDPCVERRETLPGGDAAITVRSSHASTWIVAEPSAGARIAIGDASIKEGNAGLTPATFDVSLDEASSSPVTVKYATSDATATAPADYRATTGTLTFPVGTTTKTVIVNVAGDRLDEPSETFHVQLSAPTAATIDDADGLGTILDDDRSGSFACRAVGLRLAAKELPVSNDGYSPCKDNAKSVAKAKPTGALTAKLASTSTNQTPNDLSASAPALGDRAEADASASTLQLSAGGATVRASLVTSHAEARCSSPLGGKPVLSGSTTVAGLTLNGNPIALVNGRADVTLLLGVLHINAAVTTTTSITQRGIWFDSSVALIKDVVAAEAKAGFSGNPCA